MSASPQVPTGEVLGIDPGLTITTAFGHHGDASPEPKWSCWKPKEKEVLRLAALERAFKHFLDFTQPRLVALEGYSYGSPGRQHALAEWGGVLRLLLWDAGVHFVIVPPTTLKKFATGKGNTDKRVLAVAVVKRWGIEGTEHEVDAYVLYRIALALEHYSCTGGWPDDLTKDQAACVDKLRAEVVCGETSADV